MAPGPFGLWPLAFSGLQTSFQTFGQLLAVFDNFRHSLAFFVVFTI
jgi:hypothetical protein